MNRGFRRHGAKKKWKAKSDDFAFHKAKGGTESAYNLFSLDYIIEILSGISNGGFNSGKRNMILKKIHSKKG